MKNLIFILVCLIAIQGCDKVTDTESIGPPEANHQFEHISQATPPPGFPYITAWAQAVHDVRQGSATSIVETDYLELYAVVNGVDVLVCQNDYNSFDTESKWFGLYTRYPWFPEDDVPVPMSVEYTAEGYLLFYPSKVQDKVWHWWITGNPKAVLPNGTQRIWVKMRVRITGPALVQIGADFYMSAVDNPTSKTISEFGASNWYKESPDWQVIILGK